VRPLNVFVAPRGNAFMGDIASWLVEAGGLLGRVTTLRCDGEAPDDPDAINLVVAPHEFYLLGDYSDRQIDSAARISVPVCTEQPGTPWFEITRLVAAASPAALDINVHGTSALRQAGIEARHLRLGGVPGMSRPAVTRDIELLFLGGRTPRRGEKLAELAPMLWGRAVDLRLFSFSRPVTHGVGGLVFGADKYDVLARSRILLNIHRDDSAPGYFEWARMIEAMANGCCVVTEPSADHEPLIAGEHFIETTDLAATLCELFDDPDTVAAIGARAASAVLGEFPLTETLRPELERLDEVRLTRRRRMIAPRYSARMLRAQQIPLLPAFMPTAELRQRIYRALMAETILQRRIERARCLLEHGVDDHVERFESTGYEHATPEVSVLVTLYNYADLVPETLASIVASTNIAFEIVVVDDHSTDSGRDVVGMFMERHQDVPMLLLGSDVNRGLPAARNLGFAAARGSKVMVIDADNLVYPTALRRLADMLDADPAAAFAYSALEEFGVRSGIRSAMAWHIPWLCEGNYIDAQAMIRKDAWERQGGYRTDDELVFGWEDWELWLRLAAAGGHGAYVPQMLGRYRTQQTSMLSTTNLVADHMHRHLRELYPDLPWPSVM
jgi:GT2 family glycosyltransferase